MKRLLLMMMFFCSVAMAAPSEEDEGFEISSQPTEIHEEGGMQWGRHVFPKEDWSLDNMAAFEIAMPTTQNCPFKNDDADSDIFEWMDGVVEYTVDQESGKSLASSVLFFSAKEEGEEAVGCSLRIEYQDPWIQGFDTLVEDFLSDLEDNEYIVETKELDDPVFAGYIEYRSKEFLWWWWDDFVTHRIYLGHNGEVYLLETTLEDPALQQHFFESFRVSQVS